MKLIRKLFDTRLKRFLAVLVLTAFIIWGILFFIQPALAVTFIKPFLWTVLIVSVLWLSIHFGIKAWRKRKRKEFDEAVAAKEGIDDRRREWATWVDELEKQNIDRYELPFYLLVGEPQSGKSVLLHNSDLHFPFGQNRLSGVGGTRGCDWWFTEEAVVLDLAGRLFTHEGGSADRLEFEAFLKLLYEFRPLCPANGVILVIPCDSLLKDDEEEAAAKATKIQNALLSLTTALQAQLPVYLVLTKGDQIFGFAESVHRLDVERRHQMYGWSRPADKIDAPFDVTEVTDGFQEMVKRSTFLRAHMTAGARLPEALPEVDRMYAFPAELAGMQANLEVYLKRIFSASNITDRVFFRGMYLTSGLQSGVPIAKVCSELFGQTGEADMRDLEALFSKPRAYFIKDLIRTRIFGERGLVRPTQGRVQQTRRSSVIGYGIAGTLVLLSVIFAALYLLKGTADERIQRYDSAIGGARDVNLNDKATIQQLLLGLQYVKDAVDLDPDAYEKTFTDPRDDFRELFCALFDTRMVPAVKSAALEQVDAKLEVGIKNYAELVLVTSALRVVLGEIDFSNDEERDKVLGVLPLYSSTQRTVPGGEPLFLREAFELRRAYGDDHGLLVPHQEHENDLLVRLCRLAINELEEALVPGSPTQPDREFGYMLAWSGARKAMEILGDRTALRNAGNDGTAVKECRTFSYALSVMEHIQENDLGSEGGGRLMKASDVYIQALRLGKARQDMTEFVADNGSGTSPSSNWPAMMAVNEFASELFAKYQQAGILSSLGMQFGGEDASQTFFQQTEKSLGNATAKFIVGDDETPLRDLDKPTGLRRLCDMALPLTLREGELSGLSTRINEIVNGPLATVGSGGALFNVFMAECIQLTRVFESELNAPEDAIRALGGSDAITPGHLSVPLLKELTALHLALEEFIEEKEVVDINERELNRWRRHAEALLYKHLEGCGVPDGWGLSLSVEGDFSDEAWDMLESLSMATTIDMIESGRHPIPDAAADVMRDAFFVLADQLEERWQEREINVDGTNKTVDELKNIATHVERRLENPDDLQRGGYLDDWANRVDSVLFDRLEGLVAAVEQLWNPNVDQGAFKASIDAALRELNSIEEKMNESRREGLNATGPILTGLKLDGAVTTWLDLPNSSRAVQRLAECSIPTSSRQVKNHEEYRRLLASLSSMRRWSVAEADFGSKLAETYEAEYTSSGLDDASPAINAGIHLVRETRKKLSGILRLEIRDRYLADLEDVLGDSSYSPLFDVIFWDPHEEGLEHNDDHIREALSSLLKPRRGEFTELRKRYRIHVEGAISPEIFPPIPTDDEDAWAAFHRFLVELEAFLFARSENSKSIEDAKFSFWIDPRVGTAGSLWNFETIDPEERRNHFYYPGDNSSETLQKVLLGGSVRDLKVTDWGFGVRREDRRLLFVWSSNPVQRRARTEPDRYYYEVPSCLAPLLLAWSGTPVDEDDPTEFNVDFTPTRSNRRAPLTIRFDDPIPLRPEKP